MLKLSGNKGNSRKNNTEVPLNARKKCPHIANYQQHLLARLQGKTNPTALLVGVQAGATTMDVSMENTWAIKNPLPYDPAIP